jgi:hypothetical protein
MHTSTVHQLDWTSNGVSTTTVCSTVRLQYKYWDFLHMVRDALINHEQRSLEYIVTYFSHSRKFWLLALSLQQSRVTFLGLQTSKLVIYLLQTPLQFLLT